MNKVASHKERTVYPFELTEAFAALDRALSRQKLLVSMWVDFSGYAFYTGGSDSTAAQENAKITEAIAAVATDLDLPKDWPRHLSLLFPPAPRERWEADEGGSLPPPTSSMSGDSLVVEPAIPRVVLSCQLYFAEGESELPASIGQVARAAGCKSVSDVRSLYEEAFADYPLSYHTWSAVGALMRR